jgi:hypothetical protein
MRIWIQHFRVNADLELVPDPGLGWPKIEEEKKYIFDKKISIYLYVGLDVQATGEAFSPHKKTSRMSKL